MDEPGIRRIQSQLSSGELISNPTLISFFKLAAKNWKNWNPIWHSLGFVNLTVINSPLGSLRIHIWPIGARHCLEQNWKIHDHVYGFHSQVVIGEITDHSFIVEESNESERELYRVEYSEFCSVLHKTGRLVSLSAPNCTQFQAGTIYMIPPDHFHFSEVHDHQLVVTLMATDSAVGIRQPHVVGYRNGPQILTRPVVQGESGARWDGHGTFNSIVDLIECDSADSL